MRYWWVNQNQTFAHEIAGGYLWSPRRKANGSRNPFYESMREVSPGDLILSFSDTFIAAIGIARSHCYECPKPAEFGATGAYWEQVGWKVDVYFRVLSNKIKPAKHMSDLAKLLPEKYSPLQQTGRGNQNIYLTEMPSNLMHALVSLIGREALDLMSGMHISETEGEYEARPAIGILEWEDHIQQELGADLKLQQTEKQALVMARRGQGKFKDNVGHFERRCRITHVEKAEHLRASHIKPWRDSDNCERLDGENGLLLTPSIDHLFDRGFISFEDSGLLLISPVAHKPSLEKMGVSTGSSLNVGSFTTEQKKNLDFHRNYVFLEAKR